MSALSYADVCIRLTYVSFSSSFAAHCPQECCKRSLFAKLLVG